MSTEIEKSLATVARGAGIIFFGTIIGNLLGIVNQVLMGRFLGPGDYGLFNLGISVMMIFCVLPHFGLGSALTQFIPYNIKNNRHDKVRAGIDFSLKFCLIVGVLVSITLFILSGDIATKVFHNTDLEVVIKILCIALPFWAFHNTSAGFIQAFKKPEYHAYIENIGMKVLQLSVFLILILLGYRLFGALIAYICAAIFASIAYIYILYSKLYPSLNIPVFNPEQRKEHVDVEKELVSLSWPLFLAGFTFLFMGYTDRILLGIYMTSVDIGIYAAAFAIASLMLFTFTSFSFNFRPLMAEYFAINDISGMKKLYSSITKWIFLLTFPAVIYLVFYSRDVIWLIYGGSFTKGYLALIILSMGIAMNGLVGLTGGILIAIKKTKLNLLTEIIGAVSNVGLNIILIPKFGIIGAAIGTSVSISLRSLSSLAFVYKELKIHPYTLDYIKIIIASILPLVLISFFFKTYLDTFWAFILVIPIFLILYFAFLVVTHCFDEFDKSIMKAILKKVGIVK